MMKSVLFVCLSLTSTQVWAWGDIGHETTAEIAERKLTPKAKEFVRSILGIEPLAVAATWPDKVRSDSRFSKFAPYHFVEIPMGMTFDTIPDDKRVERSADTILSQVPVLLKNPASLAHEEKQILLRYLIHLVGDVHQPLHVGNGRDMGANLCDVRWTDPESGKVDIVNLHSLWDDKMIDKIKQEFVEAAVRGGQRKPWFGYREFADMIMKESKQADFATLSAGEPKDWYAESRALHPKVYPDKSLPKDFQGEGQAMEEGKEFTPEKRPYCKIVNEKGGVMNGAYNARMIPTINDEFTEQAIPIIKKRILTGGYRLAALLNKIADAQTVATRKPEREVIEGALLSSKKPRQTQDPNALPKK